MLPGSVFSLLWDKSCNMNVMYIHTLNTYLIDLQIYPTNQAWLHNFSIFLLLWTLKCSQRLPYDADILRCKYLKQAVLKCWTVQHKSWLLTKLSMWESWPISSGNSVRQLCSRWRYTSVGQENSSGGRLDSLLWLQSIHNQIDIHFSHPVKSHDFERLHRKKVPCEVPQQNFDWVSQVLVRCPYDTPMRNLWWYLKQMMIALPQCTGILRNSLGENSTNLHKEITSVNWTSFH